MRDGDPSRPLGITARDSTRRATANDIWLAALLVLVALAVIAPRFHAPPRDRHDGLGYFSYLPALFAGRPFDMEELGRAQANYRDPATGRIVNMWGPGPAMAWLPWYAAARLTHPHLPVDHPLFWHAAGIGTAAITLAGLVLLFLALRRIVPRWAAFAAALAALLCSPLLAYCTVDVFNSHFLGFSLVSALLWLCLKRPNPGPLASAAMGTACGLLMATKMNGVVFAALPLLLARPRGWRLALGVVPAAVLFFVQMLYWHVTAGKWLMNPQERFFPGFISHPDPWLVLASPRHGYFFWHPLLLVGLVGLLAASLRKGLGLTALVLLGLFAVEVFIYSLPMDWWAHHSFGSRRLTEAVPLLAVGLAYAFSRLPWLVVPALAAAWWNLGLLWAFTTPIPQPPGILLHPENPLTLEIARVILIRLSSPYWVGLPAARHMAAETALGLATAAALVYFVYRALVPLVHKPVRP